MKKSIAWIALIFVLIGAMMLFASCGKNEDELSSSEKTEQSEKAEQSETVSESETNEATSSSEVEVTQSNSVSEEETITENAPQTEEDIYQYIKDAYNNSLAYNGAYTFNGSRFMDIIEPGDTERVVYNESAFITVDPIEKTILQELYFLNSAEDITYSWADEDKETIKVFKSDSKYYEYTNDFNNNRQENGEIETSSTSQYSSIPISAIDKQIGQALNFTNQLNWCEEEIIGGILTAENISELSNAYTLVWTDNVSAFSEFDRSKSTPPVVALTCDNGVCELRIEYGASHTGDNPYNMKVVVAIEAKKNRITRMEYAVTLDEVGEACILAEISYDFDKEKYDSVAVELPSSTNSIKAFDLSDEYVKIYVNGYSVGDYRPSSESKSVIEAYDDVTQSALSKIGGGDTNVLTNGIQKLDGWYTDPECTQKFNASTATVEQWAGVDALYANITINPDYALVYAYAESENAFSKEYQIAAVLESGGYMGVSTPLRLYDLSETSSYSFYMFYDGVYVNGIKQDASNTSLALKSEKTYEVKYLVIYTDDDMTLFRDIE